MRAQQRFEGWLEFGKSPGQGQEFWAVRDPGAWLSLSEGLE